VALGAFSAQPLSADVVINEIMAAASARLLQYDSGGVPQVGTGTRWYQPAFEDAAWESGVGPFGYGAVSNSPTPIATQLATSVQYLTPTVYFRRKFNVSAADQARAEQVQLVVDYNDGFVAYLNGVEIARRNGGPVNKFIYHDQPAYNREVFTGTQAIPTTATHEQLPIGLANARLVTGENVLAIHALNADPFDSTFYLKADLTIPTAPAVALVNYNDSWKYFPGVVEPSGNVYDPALLSSGKLVAPWAQLTFDDAAWASGAGPIGCGTPPVGVVLGTTLTSEVVGQTPSVYSRKVFTVSAAEAAETQALQLIVRYDDGFVAYLNGVEVARRRVGLPNTFTPHDAVADSAISATETITIDPPAKLLVPGNNILAIQVHNVGINDADLLIKADLKTTGPSNRFVVNNTDTWKYLPGTVEPVPQPSGEEENSVPEGPDSAVDWIELHNNGAQPVSLAGWSITDSANNKRKWIFPNVSIAAGGYLLVIADGRDITAPAPNGFLHTNFSLDADGEFVGLFDQAGVPISFIAPTFGKQSPFYSYARDAAGNYRLSDTPTPNSANAGTFFDGVVATPTVSVPGRFYTGSVNVTLSCPTPGATIRYTTDGRDPVETSTVATGPLTFPTNTALRARAFLPNAVPSDIITHTYILNEAAARRSLPAICVAGDNSQQFYRPFGIMAIVGGAYPGGIWSQSGSPLAYNAPMQSGKPAERPISFEVLHDNATPDLRTNAGIRTAGSPYSRPRYLLSGQNTGTPNTQSPWTSSDTQKPQFNIFFRDDIGSKPEDYPLVPISAVRQYDNVRLRAGKNEIGNTFIRDEFTRRLFVQMGHVTVLGDFVNLYVNGVFKGYFNICERPREPFFQQARKSDLGFDVRYITALTDGDTLAYNEMMAFCRSNNMASLANYQALQTRVDVTNFADYILLHTYAGVWDWPQNNYVMDRERSSTGVFRFSVWDAEGAFGLTGRSPTTWNQITGNAGDLSVPLNSGGLAGEREPIVMLYTVLRQSPEWRLLFADRVQKHLFNGGALTATNLVALWTQLRNIMEPMLKNIYGSGTVMTNFAASWGDLRKTAVLQQYVQQGLWVSTLAPTFSQFGGAVPNGFSLTMTNPNADGTIYYTLDGTDPRATGGAAQGTAYTAPVPITDTAVVRARVLTASNAWSPMLEATFTTATPLPLLITEIMYHSPDAGAIGGDEFEFIELKNVGTNMVNLNAVHFDQGIAFAFPPGAKLAPGAFAVVVKNAAQFTAKYPGVPIAGEWGPSSNLSNGGETLTLRDAGGMEIFSVAYDNGGQWPIAADGAGASLVTVNPNANPAPNDPVNWRASTYQGGSPGADEPVPAPITFAEWQPGFFSPAEISDPNIAGPSADPDADGLPNVMEFASGANPRVSDGQNVIGVSLENEGNAGPFLTLRYRRRAGVQGLQFHGDTAATPDAWILDGAISVGSPVNNGDGTETVKLRDTVESSAAGQRFIRLRIIGN
jgi:hypothetical protein